MYAIVSNCMDDNCYSKVSIGETKKVRQPVLYTWRWGNGDEEDPKIVRLYLRGMIEEKSEENLSIIFPMQQKMEHPLISKIRAVTENPAIDGIWLEIDSPGGAVSLSDQIYHYLCKFRESAKGRFVFVYFKSQACSGGYYVAVAADRIMAGPTAWTGSIGVIVAGYNLSKLAKTVGVESLNIASSNNKALLDPLKPVDTNHLAIVQRVVDQTYESFLALVSQRRNIPEKVLRPIADGRILSARDALDFKLIDSIGYEEDAFEELKNLSLSRKPHAKSLRVYTVELEDSVFSMPIFQTDLIQGFFSKTLSNLLTQSLIEQNSVPSFR
jgi:protease-4